MSKLGLKICTIILPFLAIYLVSCVHGAPRIVAPYPMNVYAIENEKAQVTCVVEDLASDPDELVFVRKSRFGEITPIRDEGPAGRIYYQNETLEGGRKLRVTLHFKKVVLNDDSRNGGYECQGRTGGSQHEFGFTVSVIERNELPGIEVSKNVSAKFGDKIVLSCNFTISPAGDQTKLTKMMWTKDGRLIEEVLYPREQPLKSLKIDVDSPEVGGVYTCHLKSKLRNYKEYNVTDNIYVSVSEFPTSTGTPVSEFPASTGTTVPPVSKVSTSPSATGPPVSSVDRASLTFPIILIDAMLIWLLHA